MGLSAILAGLAIRATQVLVVEAPGQWLIRVELEQQILRRGWRPAWTPADADVLAVCGVPGPELAELVDRLWEQMPGPRVRADIVSCGDVSSALDGARAVLLDTTHHRTDARERAQTPRIPEGHEGMDHDGAEDHEGMDHSHGEDHDGMDHSHAGGEDDEDVGHGGHGGGEDHEGMGQSGHGDEDGHAGMDHGHGAGEDHEGMDHGGHGGGEGHEGMGHSGHGGHGGMDMAPEGIPLAEGGEDRDGLEMDVLHLALGPVLPFWPAGLVLRCSLQGDVVIDAEASVVDGADQRFEPRGAPPGPVPAAAVRCDHAVAILALAGAEDAAARARRARDALLEGDEDAARDAVGRLHRTVRRSRMLRWSLQGVLPLDPSDLRRHGLPESCRGDAYDRLLSLVEQLRAEVFGDADGVPGDSAGTVPWEVVPHLVSGLELASVRLAVAGLGLDPFPAAQEAGHG